MILKCRITLSILFLSFANLMLLSQSSTDSSATCPIEILQATPTEQSVSLGSGVRENVVRIKFRNASAKDIRAVKFGALYFDALDDPTASYTSYIDADSLKAGKERTAVWRIWSDVYDKADAWVEKIKFVDGTKWEDDASHSCNAGVPGLIDKGALKQYQHQIDDLARKSAHDNK